jgi:hypothetical protein
VIPEQIIFVSQGIAVLISHSHARDCTGILQDKLKDQYMVTGFVRPHAYIENLINMVKNDTD